MWTWATFQSNRPLWLAGFSEQNSTDWGEYKQLFLRQHSSFTGLNTERGENGRESIIQRPQRNCVYNRHSMEKQHSRMLQLCLKSLLWQLCVEALSPGYTLRNVHTREACKEPPTGVSHIYETSCPVRHQWGVMQRILGISSQITARTSQGSCDTRPVFAL